MACESMSNFRASLVFQTLVSQGHVSIPVFSFHLVESGSELYIGGTNQNHYSGPFTYMHRLTRKAHSTAFLSMGSLLSVARLPSLTPAPPKSLGTLGVRDSYDRIPGSKYAGSGIWTIPCDFNTSVSITFSGTVFEMNASTFRLGREYSNSTASIGGIFALNSYGVRPPLFFRHQSYLSEGWQDSGLLETGSCEMSRPSTSAVTVLASRLLRLRHHSSITIAFRPMR
ncbi:hypothetical protein EDB86DRAFT_2913148 [Lactarius hatsudake]|nr:hypothetical protein EDB86DRAFT_2913148 [Lactarius hatsudake]